MPPRQIGQVVLSRPPAKYCCTRNSPLANSASLRGTATWVRYSSSTAAGQYSRKWCQHKWIVRLLVRMQESYQNCPLRAAAAKLIIHIKPDQSFVSYLCSYCLQYVGEDRHWLHAPVLLPFKPLNALYPHQHPLRHVHWLRHCPAINKVLLSS